MTARVIGWDLGGAHLKAALADTSGRLLDAVQIPCPLWQGMAHLEHAVAQVLARWDTAGARHAVTMTGEMADLFPDRATGVVRLVDHMARRLAGRPLRIYAGRGGFLAAERAKAEAPRVASANWLASASLAARRVEQGVWMDAGSTTVDIVALRAGEAASSAEGDGPRLASGELVYTGMVRTPVCAVARRVPFEGGWQSLAAELFSNMGDVYRLLGRLPEAADLMPTADGRDKSPAASAARLARMLGRDAADAPAHAWVAVARFLARRQLEIIGDALDQVMSVHELDSNAPLVAAGAGAFLVRDIAAGLGRPCVDFAALADAPPGLAEAADACAPAVAVALLQAAEGEP